MLLVCINTEQNSYFDKVIFAYILDCLLRMKYSDVNLVSVKSKEPDQRRGGRFGSTLCICLYFLHDDGQLKPIQISEEYVTIFKNNVTTVNL